MTGLDYTIVALYLGALMVVGLWMTRRASKGIDEYFLGGRKLPWWMLGASGMASNLDVTGTMINTALVFALGVSGFFVEIRGGVVLVMVWLMVMLGKWTRRAGVMTYAEMMRLRFGSGKAGDAARILAAVGSILLTIAFLTYFATGAGKFIAETLAIPAWLGMRPQFWGALFMIILALGYTVASGFHGVILTDLFQCLLIFAAIFGVCWIAMAGPGLPDVFSVSVPLKEGGFAAMETTSKAWSSAVPPSHMDLPAGSSYATFELFWLALGFYLIKTTLDGFSGTAGYMTQRYCAAKDDRDAGLLSAFWIFLLSFRWPFIVAVAIMGINYGMTHGPIQDPESVLPIVLGNMIPAGLKGLLMAGLIAAAMSTFDSVLNAGASFWVRDIYQGYISPKASEGALLFQSRISSILMVVAGLAVSLMIKNINDIWGWITMGISVGLIVPSVVRWYWWRMNGWGFAWGAAFGMAAAFIQKAAFPLWPEYGIFMLTVVSSLVGIVIGTFATKPTPEEDLFEFYRRTRPFGLWGRVRKRLSGDANQAIDRENKRDLLALCLAVPWQLGLFLMWMMLVLKKWPVFLGLLVLVGGLSVGLYFLWFRHLNRDEVKEVWEKEGVA